MAPPLPLVVLVFLAVTTVVPHSAAAGAGAPAVERKAGGSRGGEKGVREARRSAVTVA